MGKNASYKTNGVTKKLLADSVVKDNLGNTIIVISRDWLELAITKFLSHKNFVVAWSTPLSLFLTLLIVVITAQEDGFEEVLGLSSTTWYSIFIVSTLVVGIWLLLTVLKLLIPYIPWNKKTDEFDCDIGRFMVLIERECLHSKSDIEKS